MRSPQRGFKGCADRSKIGAPDPKLRTIMPEYLSPGVYVEEVSGGIKPIEGVGTSTGAFIGIAEKGPIAGAQYEDGVGQPVLITNFTEFTRTFGSFVRNEFLAYAVQQFFGEGGTRCYVARTAHYGNPADRTTLTATRASAPLGGIATTLAAVLNAGETQAQLASAGGIQTGMALNISGGGRSHRVIVTGIAGNTVIFVNSAVPAGVTFASGATVAPVILDVFAIHEGEWGNNLRVAVTPHGRIATTLDMPGDAAAVPPVPAGLPANATQATLRSLEGISVGSSLFIADATNAVRVQVTRINESARQITYRALAPATPAAIANGAQVTGTNPGKASTVLNGAVAAGATEAVLQSTDNIEIGTILLFVAENMGNPVAAPPVPPSVTVDRVVVTRVVGRRVIFTPALVNAYADRTTVTTEDFTITVSDRDDVVETFPNLTMENTNGTDYAETRVNLSAGRSKYIRVREAPLLTGNTPPLRTALPVTLTGGLNGDPDDQGDYIGNQATQTGFFAFDTVDDINILAAPGITLRPVILAGMTYCQNRADCFFVGEVPLAAQTVTEVLDFKNGTGPFAGQQALISKYGALYFPWIRAVRPIRRRS